MNFLPLLETKRDGGSLTPTQLREMVGAFTAGRIPDYQMAAFLMAVFFRGLSGDETRALTLAMRDSGDILRLPADPRPVVDKHSTGGVGDEVSLALAPLLACRGVRGPVSAGRGLGITGGTLDKLESIPGLTTQLAPDQFAAQVQAIGVAMGGQTATMVPADKLLYALRDATGTVPSIPLITASILSKKLAEGLDALVMDVKFGAAAFMQTREQASELARTIVALAGECDLKTRVLLTSMDSPLGRAAGNWLEVKEAVRCLEGYGPDDLQEIVVECAASLSVQTGKANAIEGGRAMALACLASGAPRAKFDELIAAQGADLAAFRRKLASDSTAPVALEVITPEEGFITRCDARIIGEIVRDLGGGRMRKDSIIHPDVGVDMLAEPGEPFGRGSLLGRVHARTEEEANAAAERLRTAFTFAEEPAAPAPLIAEMI